MTINYLDSKRIQGLSTERAYLTETVYNQGNAGWQGALPLYGAGNTRIGIRVESGSSSIGKTISKIRGELSATNAGAGVTGTFRWTIRNNTDTLIAYTPDVNASTLPEATTEANIEYTFNVARSLLEGDRIQLEYSGGDATHTVNLSYNNTAPAMPSGFKQCKYNGSYTDISNFPVYFITDSSPALVNNLPNIQTNSIFEQTDNSIRYWYDGNNWFNNPTRGVFGSGNTGTASNVIDYITIATTGNATDFGDLTDARDSTAGVNSDVRGIFGGGYSTSYSNVMDYITIATTGNAVDFGDLTESRNRPTGVNTSTRGIFAGGHNNSTFSNVIDYITIATTGNAVDFGDLTDTKYGTSGVNSDVRGVFGGGRITTGQAISNIIDYITMATTGNATDFGDLTVARYYLNHGVNSNVRGVFTGGLDTSVVVVSTMDYITIATIGNATTFGNLSVVKYGGGGVNSLTRGVFGGGGNGSYTAINVIDYITIATTGNATDFGDLSVARIGVGGVQNGL